jgi:hypothetical protein
MKIAPLAEVKDRLSAYIDFAKESAIVVTRNGKPVEQRAPPTDAKHLGVTMAPACLRGSTLLPLISRAVSRTEAFAAPVAAPRTSNPAEPIVGRAVISGACACAHPRRDVRPVPGNCTSLRGVGYTLVTPFRVAIVRSGRRTLTSG